MVSPASTGLIQRRSRKPGDGPHTATFSPRATASAPGAGRRRPAVFMQAEPTCQPDAASPPNSELRALLLVEVKALRIEFRGERLDGLGGEGVRADLAALADLDLLEEMHRSTRPSRAPDHDRRGHLAQRLARRVARGAFERDDAESRAGSWRRAPRRHRRRASDRRRAATAPASAPRSTPGEPSEAVRPMKPSNIIRIITEQRCQPEPDRPLQHELLRRLLVEMHRLRIELGGECQDFLARDMARAERAETAGLEVFEGQGHARESFAGRKPDCGRYLRQSQPDDTHGACACDSRCVAGLSGGVISGLGQRTTRRDQSSISLGEDRCSIFRTCFSGTASSRPRSSRRSTGW